MDARRLSAIMDATWPASSIREEGPWTIRTGAESVNRVNAATLTSPAAAVPLIEPAVAAMRAQGRVPMFAVRDGEDALDLVLEAAGYGVKEPVALYTAPIGIIATGRPPPVTTFESWPPLACQTEIWADGGIGPERIAIMDRVKGPKTSILGRLDDTPAGTGFIALRDGTAMIHALETAEVFRRRGLGRHMVRAMAHWAEAQGATELTLLVTRANTAANALYASMGFEAMGGYHYRIYPEAP